MSTLTLAIERRQWELASLLLLTGVVRAASALPPQAVEGLLEVLAGLEETNGDGRQRRGGRRGRRR
jgi:hypothetical protein